MPGSTNALYRMFDDTGALLYVGISNSPMKRFREHGSEKRWWHSVHTITLSHYETRADAERAEAIAISSEMPLYNVKQAAHRSCVEPGCHGAVWTVGGMCRKCATYHAG